MTTISFEKDFSRHPLHYFTLLSVQSVGLWGIFWYNHQPSAQLVILAGMAASYVIWGIAHHEKHRDLHFKIVAEYVLVALLALLIFGAVLYHS